MHLPYPRTPRHCCTALLHPGGRRVSPTAPEAPTGSRPGGARSSVCGTSHPLLGAAGGVQCQRNGCLGGTHHSESHAYLPDMIRVACRLPSPIVHLQTHTHTYTRTPARPHNHVAHPPCSLAFMFHLQTFNFICGRLRTHVHTQSHTRSVLVSHTHTRTCERVCMQACTTP